MKKFMDKDFLLSTETAKKLYAACENTPIFDWHCHLQPKEIYENKEPSDITYLWLSGEKVQILQHDHFAALLGQKDRLLKRRIAAAGHAHAPSGVEVAVAYRAERDAVSDKFLFSLDTEHAVLYAGCQDHCRALVDAAFFGPHYFDIAAVLHRNDILKLDLGALRQDLVQHLLRELISAHLKCSRIILNLG